MHLSKVQYSDVWRYVPKNNTIDFSADKLLMSKLLGSCGLCAGAFLETAS